VRRRCVRNRAVDARDVIQIFAFGCFRGFELRLKQLQVAEPDNRSHKQRDPSFMALDVYVGSLTRYYAGEWENISERSARERGTQFRIERRVGSGDSEPEIQEILQAILGWRVELNQSLGNRIAKPLDWREDLDAPYYTGRPGWDGFGSLVLWAAYAEHPAVRRPASLPEEWDNDPVLVRSSAAGFRSRYSHLVRNVELWLPNPFDFTFEGEDVDGRRVVVGSTATLRRQLEDLNAATWKADAEIVASWRRDVPADNGPLEQSARYAYAVLLDLAERSVELRLPMKLDH
jgi:hypothetical protein